MFFQCSCDKNIREREVICIRNSTGRADIGSECDIKVKPQNYEDCECMHQVHFRHHHGNQSDWKIGPWAEVGFNLCSYF